MKQKKYEEKRLISIIFIIIIILEIIILLFCIKTYKFTYKRLTGIVIKKDLLLVIVNKKERKLLYDNKKIYLEDKYITYKIEEDKGKILKKNNKNYYELIISTKISSSLKANDSINISIENKKINMIKLLQKLKEGDTHT